MGKKGFLAILISSIVLACAGCGGQKNINAEEAAAKMQSAVTETPCTHMKLDTDVSVKIEMPFLEEGMRMTMKSLNDIVVQEEPLASYAKIDSETEVMGENQSGSMETYTMLEDGRMVVYMNVNGVWTKTDTSMTEEQLRNLASAVRSDHEDFSIDHTVKKWKDKDVICLISHMEGEELREVIGGISGDAAAGEEFLKMADVSRLSSDSHIYLDAETFLPIEEKLVIHGLGDAMNLALGKAEMFISEESFQMTISYLSFEPQETIVLPEEALNAHTAAMMQ